MIGETTTRDVRLYSTENEERSTIVERWKHTIKRMMWKYFTANNTTYTNALPEIIDKYNSTYHRAIKCTPTLAREPSNYQHVFEALYAEKQSSVNRAKYKVGDRVRIVKKKIHSKKASLQTGLNDCLLLTK